MIEVLLPLTEAQGYTGALLRNGELDNPMLEE